MTEDQRKAKMKTTPMGTPGLNVKTLAPNKNNEGKRSGKNHTSGTPEKAGSDEIKISWTKENGVHTSSSSRDFGKERERWGPKQLLTLTELSP